MFNELDVKMNYRVSTEIHVICFDIAFHVCYAIPTFSEYFRFVWIVGDS